MRYVHIPTGTEVESETRLPSALYREATSKAKAAETASKAKESSRGTTKTTK